MTVEQLIFGAGAPYQAESETSYEAAAATKPFRSTLRLEVFDYIKANGPVTDNQIIEGMHKNASSVRPRRIELTKDGQIRQSGTVEQPNGRKAVTWVAA